MFPIIEKTVLNPSVVKIKLDAPLIAKKVLPGQFIIFRIDEYGERVPLTVADYDREAGTITLIFQIVGHTTERLAALNAGDSILDLVGPLGVATEIPEGVESVCVVGGGVGCAWAVLCAFFSSALSCKTSLMGCFLGGSLLSSVPGVAFRTQ